MNPQLALLLWGYRRELLTVLIGLAALFFILLTAIASAFIAGVPLVPDHLLPVYQEVAYDLRAPDGSQLDPAVQWTHLIAIDSVRYGQDFSRVTRQTIQDLAELFIETQEHPGGEPCAPGDAYCSCYEGDDPETGEPAEICRTDAYTTYQRRDSAAVYALLGLTDEQTRQLIVMAPVDLTVACTGFVPNPASPYTWPVHHLRITSCYGPRADPVTGEPQFHYGLDLEAAPGEPVLAATAGTIHLADWTGDYGHLIILISPDGLHTWYGHLSGYAVSTGEVVTQGQLIGYAGNTGKSTGPHLHFEIRPQGNPVNPITYYR